MSLLSAMVKTRRGGRMSREDLALIRKKRLKDLVEYARLNSPYYEKLYEDVGEDFSLENLPPVSKTELMEHFDDVLTDRYVTMDRVVSFTEDPDNIGRLLDGKYLVFKTSGSTGNPAVVLYDKTNIDVSSAVAAFRTFARKEDLKAFMRCG